MTNGEKDNDFMQIQYVCMKLGIQALLSACEKAEQQGLFSIDTVRFMAEHQINTINVELDSYKEELK